MRIFFTFLAAFFMVLNLSAHPKLEIETNVVHPNDYSVVKADDYIHAVEGASVTYTIKVSDYDSNASVERCYYTINNVERDLDLKLNEGKITTYTVRIPNLGVNEGKAYDFKVTLIVTEGKEEEEEDKNNYTTIETEAEKIKVYSTPEINMVNEPETLIFYKSSDEKLEWSVKGDGGGTWKYEWAIDGSSTEETGSSFTLEEISAISESVNNVLTLTATNTAPDGITTWFTDTIEWKVCVYKEATIMVTEEPDTLIFYDNSGGDLKWSVKGDGGGSWKYEWAIDGSSTEETGSSFTLKEISAISESVNNVLTLTATNTAPDGITPWFTDTIEWKVCVFKKATIKATEQGTKKLFQEQTWPLEVTTEGGDPAGWTYTWEENNTILGSGERYILSINETLLQKDSITVTLTVQNKLPDGTKNKDKVKDDLTATYVYQAFFYPQPKVKFASNYPQNICNGDSVEFKLDILNDNDQPLSSHKDYEWEFLWNEQKGDTTYTFKGNNSDNDEGKTQNINCKIACRLDSTNYVDIPDLTHSLTVWPLPKVESLTDEEAERESCGGQTLRLSAKTHGGQKDGWKFTYKKGENIIVTSEDNFYDLTLDDNSDDVQKYYVQAVNMVEDSVRCNTTLEISVTVYPSPQMPKDIVVTDVNRGNALVGSGIREGNKIKLSCEECYGGYPGGWTYSWKKDNNGINGTLEAEATIENTDTGDTMDNNSQVTFSCIVNNISQQNEKWAESTYTKQLTIYHKPKTPKSLVIKGSGASNTAIATTDGVKDEDLINHKYFLVFGYRDKYGKMHDEESLPQEEPGKVRWSTQLEEDVVNDPSNTLYVYALWKYNDGVEITSGLRTASRINGNWVSSADEDWDDSSYDGKTRSVLEGTTGIVEVYDTQETDTAKEYYMVNGTKSSTLVKGINIIRMSNGSVKKVMMK